MKKVTKIPKKPRFFSVFSHRLQEPENQLLRGKKQSLDL